MPVETFQQKNVNTFISVSWIDLTVRQEMLEYLNINVQILNKFQSFFHFTLNESEWEWIHWS